MEKKHIITIAGKPGSGKSFTSKTVAANLGYKHFSSGDLFRAIGKERGINVLATNLAAEQEKEIDHMVDEKLRDIYESEDELVIDSRMAWHWMSGSFKVYLDLDLEVAATRILADMDTSRRSAEDIPEKPSEYAERLQDRLDSEIKRYSNLYNVNPYDVNNYDLVIDTQTHSKEQAVDRVITEYKKWIEA
jgi:predicted cytidylate kinase